MPQATAELHKLMEKRFGDPICDQGPIKYLEDAGYVLTKGWEWKPKPGVTDLGGMTQAEFECLVFLVQEWDFGTVIFDKDKQDATNNPTN